MPRLIDRRFRSYFQHNDDGTIHEYSALTCAHGNEIIVRKPEYEQGINWDFCIRCNAPICLKCARKMAKTGECEAFEKQLLRRERFFAPGQAVIHRDLAMLLGRDSGVVAGPNGYEGIVK